MTRPSTQNPDAVTFGAVLRALRTRRGWTIRKCAQRLGVNPTHLGIVEAGGNMPSLWLLLEAADTFNVAPSEIMRLFEEGRKARRGVEASAILPSP